ncbi:MAG TPA: sigma factor-like helix-turn-helix DNA-binding protein [Acidimicrobiia bacterium]|nr:sigma factor-like helix-turn-helix DNA-binding protein [Acidimicrobiia bacterium]
MGEVAEILGVAVGTVKSRVFRGRRLLAEQLGNQSQ